MHAVEAFRSPLFFAMHRDGLRRLLEQLPQHTAALRHVQNQIAIFSNQVAQIPQNKPTPQDFEAGRCIETHLMD